MIDGSEVLIPLVKIILWSVLVLACAYLVELWKDRRWRK